MVINIDELKEYFKISGQILPCVFDYIKTEGRLPNNISVEQLDYDILIKILEINDEFFDNLHMNEVTDKVWEYMVVLKPEEYFEIAPEHILNSTRVIINALNYNKHCIEYFNDEQALLLSNILVDKKCELNIDEFIDRYASREIIDLLYKKQSFEFLTEIFTNQIFDKKIGNYLFKKRVCKNNSFNINGELLILEPQDYYSEIFKNGISFIQYFPEQYQTEDMWIDAVVKKPNLFKVMPTKYINKESCEKMFNKNVKTIKYIPKEFLSQEMCDLAYIKNKEFISCFPEQFITNDMIQDTINKKGNIDYIIKLAQRRGIMNLENFKEILNYSLKYLQKIDKEYYDRGYIEKLLCSEKWPGVLSNIDIAYFDYELLYMCATKSLKILKRLLPYENINKLMDERILNIYLTSDFIKLDLINDSLLTIDVLRIALEKNSDALNTLPEDRRTIERCEIAKEYSGLQNLSSEHSKGKQLKKVYIK